MGEMSLCLWLFKKLKNFYVHVNLYRTLKKRPKKARKQQTDRKLNEKRLNKLILV